MESKSEKPHIRAMFQLQARGSGYRDGIVGDLDFLVKFDPNVDICLPNTYVSVLEIYSDYDRALRIDGWQKILYKNGQWILRNHEYEDHIKAIVEICKNITFL